MSDDSGQPAQLTPEPPTLTELLDELRTVQLKIHAARHRERKKHIAEAQWSITEFGIQPHELRFPQEYGPERRPSNEPKYYDPETGQTWSGEGAKPAWLRGKKLTQYEIEWQLKQVAPLLGDT